MKALPKGEERAKHAERYRTGMTYQNMLERIIIDPKIMTGKPAIRNTRLTVEFILNLSAHGATTQEIMAEYSGLTEEDIRACILFSQK